MRLLRFLIVVIFILISHNYAYADKGAEGYILKLKNDENIYVISEEERDIILDNRSSAYSLRAYDIEYIEPNYEVFLLGDTTQANWNYDAVNSSYAGEWGCFGNDIRIGVIDSGIYEHEYFGDSILPGYNFITNTDDVYDDVGHGTFVSSIISSNESGLYATGISCKAKIIPLKCFANNYETGVADIDRAIRAAVDDYNCRIINMSFGMRFSSITLKNAIEYALSKGVVLVAAVGNYGTEEVLYPAGYDGVIGVGSVNSTLEHSDFSHFNASVDIAAPGEGIKAKTIDAFVRDSGTSFSAPHVSAAAAIALCIDDTLTPEDFFDVITQTAFDLGTVGYDSYYGYGLLDIEAMCQRLIRKNDFFASPVNIVGDTAQIILMNNTDNVLYPLLTTTEQTNNGFVCADISKLSLSAYEKRTLSLKKPGKTTKYYFWDSLIPLRPMSISRSYYCSLVKVTD